MTNKSRMFKGLTASDINPLFRADVALLAVIPSSKAIALANLLVEDFGAPVPTPNSFFAREVAKNLQIPADQAVSLTRAARSFATRFARRDDDPDLIVGDLIEMQVSPPAGKDSLLSFLNVVRQHRSELTVRANKQEVMIGGGYHLGPWAVFTDFRVAFDKFDISDVDLDTYRPIVSGLIPVVTLQLELHLGDDEKTINIRLPESDLAKLESALKVARLQLAAAQSQIPGGR